MTGDPAAAPASERSPWDALAGDWRLATAALALHTDDGSRRPEELCAEGELHLAAPTEATVSVRLVGVGGIERIGFEFNFDSESIHGNDRAGSVDGLLRIAGAATPVRLWFEFQALVGDARQQQHAVFTTEVPLGLLGLQQRGYATLELDFVRKSSHPTCGGPPSSADPSRIVGRRARPNEDAAVRALLEFEGGNRANGDRPLASVVALLGGEVVGAARAWRSARVGAAWAAFGVARRWRNVGIPSFLGALLANELQILGVCTIAGPPRPDRARTSLGHRLLEVGVEGIEEVLGGEPLLLGAGNQ